MHKPVEIYRGPVWKCCGSVAVRLIYRPAEWYRPTSGPDLQIQFSTAAPLNTKALVRLGVSMQPGAVLL